MVSTGSRYGRLPHQQGLCEARLATGRGRRGGYQDRDEPCRRVPGPGQPDLWPFKLEGAKFSPLNRYGYLFRVPDRRGEFSWAEFVPGGCIQLLRLGLSRPHNRTRHERSRGGGERAARQRSEATPMVRRPCGARQPVQQRCGHMSCFAAQGTSARAHLPSLRAGC